ncbi:MAG TPA: Ig-like domain-containing protein [Bacillota bacterium]|nr:Ig-like domain-containing protein [Bacillota bacterium]
MPKNVFFSLLFLILLGFVSGCGGSGGGGTNGASVTIQPAKVTLGPGVSYQFKATVSGSTSNNVTWSVSPEGGGSVTATGLYTAPGAAGTYYVKAASAADPAKNAQATVTVVSGSLSGNNYTGTITIENTGTEGDLTVNQSASLTVTLVQQNCPDLPFAQFGTSDPSFPATVNANINDREAGDEPITITGSLTSAKMNSPQLVVLLQIKETTYNLLIGGIPINCTFSGNGVSITQPYNLLGRSDNEHSLPANKSRITGSIQLPAEGLPGITQKITWDLQANF